MDAAEYRRWLCDACGYIYDEAAGDPDSGLAPGTLYEDIPEDWQCPLCGLRKSDLRLLPKPKPLPVVQRSSKPGKDKLRGSNEHLVILGAGIAGWAVAEAVRAADPAMPILMITACDGASYPKPALSTAIAHHKAADELIDGDAQTRAQMLDIGVLTQTRVLKVDTRKKRIVTAKGGISYGKLVLALGANQRRLSIAGDAADQVLRINDLASYRVLRERLAQGAKHVTILGAGLIGTEFAEDLSAGGISVTVVDPSEYPLASMLPAQVATELRQRLHEKGVQWVFGCTLDSLESQGDHYRATLSNGEAFETDITLSAAGLLPNIDLAKKAGLTTDKGIETNLHMQTSDPDIYALGDCAAVNGKVFAYIEPIRRQAQTIAANLHGDNQSFDLCPPLVRVKTPSFPLALCLPDHTDTSSTQIRETAAGRLDYYTGDQLVGFVLSGASAADGSELYRQLLK